ncbi:hypothetical protein HYT00_00550 [Candidatus Giovannonibacteria bacterium]|nr:hypothetical protein [Candidatus Giovannonibacteria bacterium]
MDIISHGLWGSLVFGRSNKKSFWKAFLFGVAPDFIPFAPFFILMIFGFAKYPGFSTEPPVAGAIPDYVYFLYKITHSLVIFAVVFFGAWLIKRKFFWPMAAWGIHVLLDIPTHSYKFFPTPFLWPVANFEINGIPWADPIIFFPNVLILAILYYYFFVYRKRYAK